MGEKEKNKRQEPISLLKLVTLGVASSILVVGGLFLLFAAYESQTWLFWTAEEHLDPDTLFGVGRNAVTLAAALGVGVTLFFSYRKQQTAEQAQELAYTSQETANKAQALATKTLQLSLDKHELERVSELRNRYARSAEQLASDKLAIQMAGVYSLAALADDWISIDNASEQQVCISLLCSYVTQPEGADKELFESGRNTAAKLIVSRLKSGAAPPKAWSNSALDFTNAKFTLGFEDIKITGGEVALSQCQFMSNEINNLRIDSGKLTVHGNVNGRRFPNLTDAYLQGGKLTLFPIISEDTEKIQFSNCNFTGSEVTFFSVADLGCQIEFLNCKFSGGSVDLWFNGPLDVMFRGCVFESSSMIKIHNARTPAGATFMGCQYLGSAEHMEADPQSSVLAAPTNSRSHKPQDGSHGKEVATRHSDVMRREEEA